MFYYLTWLFSDSEIARELGPDMVSKSWDPDYEENRSMCAEMILERRENEEFDKASDGIFIQLFFNKTYYNYIIVIYNLSICACPRYSKCP